LTCSSPFFINGFRIFPILVSGDSNQIAQQTIGDNISTNGDISFENITQIGHQTIIQGEFFFEEVSVNQSNFHGINIQNQTWLVDLVNKIERKKVVVLEGDRNVRKPDITRYIAYRILQKYINKKISVKESIRDLNIGLNLQYELRRVEEPTVFILSDISFKTFGASFEKLKESAATSGHYIIATTNESKEAWRSENQDWFCKIIGDDIENCDRFIDKLSDERLISEWYYNEKELSSHEQLLAIALSLFDETYGDQFFAALEHLVENIWKRRDPKLRALDYCDLDKLLAFFSFSGRNEQEETIKVTSSRQRQLLLKVAWSSHRRQILSALPILVGLAKNSIEGNSLELYGSPERRARIRQTISESISNIGLISQESKVFEEQLLSLASDKHIEVQAVAATALAVWRNSDKKELIQLDSNSNVNGKNKTYYNPDQKLFNIITRWQEQTQIVNLVDSFLRSKNYNLGEKPVNYIRATIALTVGLASESDPYDQMSEELLDLFRKLVIDKSKLVRDRVFFDALPRIVRRHTRQIQSELENFLIDADIELIVAISKSLSEAYKFRPDAVLDILESWKEKSQVTESLKIIKGQKTIREALRSTVALTYGELNTESIERIINHLQSILSDEKHPFVRSLAIVAVGMQSQKYFDDFKIIEPKLKGLVSEITQKERNEIANILTNIYLKQRASLTGGDRVIEIQGKQYSVWLDSQRPLTAVEQAMISWAKDDSNISAQQVATHASVNFVYKFDKEEAEKIEQLREEIESKTIETIEEYPLLVKGADPPEGWYMGKLIPWLVARNFEDYRTSIRNLLPESLFHYKRNRENMNFVLEKWQNTSDEDIENIADRLKPGIFWAENMKWVMVSVALIVVSLVNSSINQLGKLPSNNVQEITQPGSNSSRSSSSSTLPTTSQSPTTPQPQDTNATVTGDARYDKNVRSGVTTSSPILFELPVGSRVRIIGSRRNADNYLWYKIYSPQYRREGWIAEHLIERD